MFDNYFSTYENIIQPRNYSRESITRSSVKELTKAQCGSFNSTNWKDKQNKNNTSILSTDNNEKIRQLFITERKSNMFLRAENTELNNKLKQLQIEYRELAKENIKFKCKIEQDSDYLIQWERLVNRWKNESSKENKKYFDKNFKELKSNFKINLINSSIISSSQYSNNSSSILSSENNTMKADNTDTVNNNDNEEIHSLKHKIKSLVKFKDKIYALSKQYDDINLNIFEGMKKVQNCFKEINDKYYNKINDDQIQLNYKVAFDECNNINNNIQSICDQMCQYIKTKKDEYNFWLNESDIKLVEYYKTNKKQNKWLKELENQMFIKENQIQEWTNQIYILKDINETQKWIKLTKKCRLLSNTKTFNDGEMKKWIKKKMNVCQKSRDRTVCKIQEWNADKAMYDREFYDKLKKV